MAAKTRLQTRKNILWEHFPPELREMIIKACVEDCVSRSMKIGYDKGDIEMIRRVSYSGFLLIWLAFGEIECMRPFIRAMRYVEQTDLQTYRQWWASKARTGTPAQKEEHGPGDCVAFASMLNLRRATVNTIELSLKKVLTQKGPPRWWEPGPSFLSAARIAGVHRRL